jgi:hypothetical protein
VKDDAAHKLDIKVALANGAAGGFPDGSEGFGHKLVQQLALLKARFKLVGFSTELVVSDFLESGFQ